MTELFANFEVNRESRWPVLLRLMGASVALHLTLAASVLYVPTFRDALNLGLMAGNASYVDRPYNRTVIGDDVQMIAVGPKFRYPDGYFATGFPTGIAAPTPDPLVPKIIATYTPPKTISIPTPMPSPQPSPSASPSSPVVAGNNNAPKPAPENAPAGIKADVAADTKKTEDDDVVLGLNANEYNTRPLKDWLARANALREKGILDLNADLEMTIDARLNSECKLEDPKVVQKSGDQQLVEVAKDLAAAMSDSHMLLFLRDPSKKEQKHCDPMSLRFSIKLDQSDFNAAVQTEADSPDRAAQLTRLYNWALAGGEVNARIKKKDEEQIFKNTKVTAEGKQIVVRFKMPRTTAGEMLKKQIDPKPAG